MLTLLALGFGLLWLEGERRLRRYTSRDGVGFFFGVTGLGCWIEGDEMIDRRIVGCVRLLWDVR